MATRFASAKNSIAECDRCGFRYKLTDLKKLVIKTKVTNIKVCPQCWEPDQPQLQIGMFPVHDPQAVREPRPDTTYFAPGFTMNSAGVVIPNGAGGSREIEWGWNPVGGARSIDAGLTPNALEAVGAVGSVTAGNSLIGLSFQLVAGLSNLSDDYGTYTATGYGLDDAYYGTFGDANPTTVLGYPITVCYDGYDSNLPSPTRVFFAISDLPDNPGQTYFTSLACNGHTLVSADASYTWGTTIVSYNPATALWVWDATQLGLVSGQTYTVTFT